MYPITTPRLRLFPASTDLLDADMAWQINGNDAALRFLLNIDAVAEWPPTGSGHDINGLEFFRAQIVRAPFSEEWYAYYVCLGKQLVASAGFFGPPADGEVEIGYSVGTPVSPPGYRHGGRRRLTDQGQAIRGAVGEGSYPAGQCGVDRPSAEGGIRRRRER